MPNQPQKLTKGTINKCPCPWCGDPQNFKDVEDYGVEVGAVHQCERCNRHYEIKRVEPVTVLFLAPYLGKPRF